MGKYQKRDRIARLISWGHWFTFTNIVLCLAIGLLYIESAETTGTLVGNLYLFMNWLGHFAFLPFVFFILLLFPFCLILPYSRILRGLGALIASFGIFILLFDAFFFRQYGFHLNTYSLAQIARDAETVFTGGSFVALLGVLFGFLVIVSVQVTLANLTWKRLDRIRDNQLGGAITAVFVSSFLASHIIHIWADATLYTPITQQDDLLPLSYPTTAKTLMARHGWITPDTYHTQRNRLTDGEEMNLRYPISSLLCAKEPVARATLVVAFDRLSDFQQRRVESRIPTLQPLARRSVSHRDVSSAGFQLAYSLPDLYRQQIEQRGIEPAYQRTMQDFGHQVQFFHSANWPLEYSPGVIQSQLVVWPSQSSTHQPLTVIFASERDLESMLATIHAAQVSNQRVLVTALASSGELLLNEEPLLNGEFNVPMWSANMNLPEHEFAMVQDILPTALSGFMSCAEDFRGFAIGRDLTSAQRNYPRVQSVDSRIYIYEEQQITVIDGDGDMSVFTLGGELKPGAIPPTPVLINSLQELQRFGSPAN